MEIKNSALLNEAHSFFNEITKRDRVAIIHHTDTDGICSANILYTAVSRIRNKPPELIHNQKSYEHKINEETYNLLKKNSINKVLITDITADEDPFILMRIAEFAKVILIDHHQIYNDISSNNFIMIKPQLIFSGIDPSQYCCSKLSYDLLKDIVNIEDRDWVACAGIIGDINTNTWMDFVKEVHRKNKIAFLSNPFETIIGLVAVYLTDAEAYDSNLVATCFNIIKQAKTPGEVLETELKKYHECVEKELRLWLDSVETKAEIYKELIIYPIKPKYNIKSALSTILGLKYPNHVLVIYIVRGDKAYFSLRRSDYKFKMNELIREATKNCDDSTAGGHIPAAGGTVKKSDVNYVTKFIINAISKGKFRNGS